MNKQTINSTKVNKLSLIFFNIYSLNFKGVRR